MFICKYCNKERKTQRSVNAHQPLCKLNPNAKPIKQKTEAYYAAIAKRKHSNQYTKARDEGRPAPILSNETKNKISIAMSKRNKERFSDPLERQKHADAMLEAVRKHPDSYTKNNVCGRVKIVEYNGIKLKGKWELKVAKWLDGQNIYWQNEPSGFPYHWNNADRLYFPDFYLPEHNIYIEVKGYKTERDEAKWTQFTERLVVIDKKYIDNLEEYDVQYIIEHGSVV
mgnify:CR=1 FL=1|jgi:hypothetical protein